MMSHATELNLSNVRRRSLLLVGLMVLSVLVGAIDVTASNAKHYPVARAPTTSPPATSTVTAMRT